MGALTRLIHSNLLLFLGHNFTVQIPGKLYEYLRSGRPILAWLLLAPRPTFSTSPGPGRRPIRGYRAGAVCLEEWPGPGAVVSG